MSVEKGLGWTEWAICKLVCGLRDNGAPFEVPLFTVIIQASRRPLVPLSC